MKDSKEVLQRLQAAGCDVVSGDTVKPGKKRKALKGQKTFLNDRGQKLSNTGPVTSKPGPFLGGEDTMHVSVYVRWPAFDQLTEMLELKRVEAQASDEGSVIHRRNGFSFVVTSHGKRHGPIFFNWCVKCEGVTIFIRNCPDVETDAPNVFVEVGSLELMIGGGAGPMWERVEQMIRGLGGFIQRNKLSRIDSCVDCVGVSVAELVGPFRLQSFITRAKNRVEYGIHSKGLQETGFTIGAGIKCRVYDKLLEVKHNEAKLAALKVTRWAGQVPEKSTRVEFQLTREDIKEFGVESVQDWIAKREGVVRYLCEEWLRFVDGPVDRTNTTRAKTLPLWKLIGESFAAWASSKVKSVSRKIVRKTIDTAQRTFNWMGGALSEFAMVHGTTTDVSEVMGYMLERVEFFVKRRPWVERLRDKVEALKAKTSVFVTAPGG